MQRGSVEGEYGGVGVWREEYGGMGVCSVSPHRWTFHSTKGVGSGCPAVLLIRANGEHPV